MKMKQITNSNAKQQIYVVDCGENDNGFKRSITDRQMTALGQSLRTLKTTDKHLERYALSPVGLCPYNEEVSKAAELIAKASSIIDEVATELLAARADMYRKEMEENEAS